MIHAIPTGASRTLHVADLSHFDEYAKEAPEAEEEVATCDFEML